MHGGTTEQAPSPASGMTGDASASARASRLARRRTALPSSRAVVGGLLVTTSVVAMFVVASGAARGPAGRAVIANRDLPIGHRISADDIRVEAVEVPDASASQLFTTADGLIGAVTTGPLDADDLIVRSAVLASGESAAGREFSFPLDRERAVNGRLRAGESVDV